MPQQQVTGNTTSAVLDTTLNSPVLDEPYLEFFPIGLQTNAYPKTAFFYKVMLVPLSSSVTASLAGIPRNLDIVFGSTNADKLKHAGTRVAAQQAPTASQMVHDILARSGLTREQLAKALGVSRRTLYLWTNGSTISAMHIEHLTRFDALVRKFDTGDSSSTRLSLLRTGADGLSAYDRFRIERGRNTPPVTAFPLSAAQLLIPTMHESPATQH